MAKALETTFANFTPSPLQRAAIKRMQEYQKELKEKYGMYVRSAIELEFMVEDQNKTLVTGVINLKQAEQFLKDPAQHLPHLERVGTDATSEYEFTIADIVKKTDKINPAKFSPVGVAANAATLKQGTLKKMLQESTCLNSEWANDGRVFSPVFRAFSESPASDKTLSQKTSKTSALHVNISLYDKGGKNLFNEFPDLMKHSASALVDLQHEAGLTMLPKKNSLQRLWANQSHLSVPGGLGVDFVMPEATGKHYSSVNMRGGGLDNDITGPHQHNARIENRLPGADADPFVSMAVTMAALVDAVHNHVHRAESTKKGVVSLKVERFGRTPYPQHDLPRRHKTLVTNYTDPRHAHHLNELLGKELYQAILSDYQNRQDVTR